MSESGNEEGAELDEALDLLSSLPESQRRLPSMPQVSGWENDTDGIEEEPDPHESPAKEILWAAENGDVEVLKRLLALDLSLVDVTDKDGYTPLHRASYNNHSEVVKMLLLNGANHGAKTIDNWQPLHSACKWNSLECAALLVSHGADINATSKGGVTPLHLAAGHGDASELVQMLLSDPELIVGMKDSTGDTPQDIARRSGPHEHLFQITEPCFL